MSVTNETYRKDSPESSPEERPSATGSTAAWREWMMVSVGLTGLLAVLAIIVSVVALTHTNPNPGPAAQPAAPATGMTASMGSSGAAMSTMSGKPEAVKLVMKSDSERAEKGPDGQWHDAVIPGNFMIHAGDKVTMTVYNYDDMPHTFTSTDLSVNQTIPAGSENAPSKTMITFTAPAAGQYQWWCALPCDPYSMSTDGLMKGMVTVKA